MKRILLICFVLVAHTESHAKTPNLANEKPSKLKAFHVKGYKPKHHNK